MSELPKKIIKNFERYGLSRFLRNASNIPIRNTVPDHILVDIGFSKISEIIFRADLPTHDDIEKVIFFSEKKDIDIGLPHYIKPVPESFIKYCGEYHMAQPFVCKINDISLVGTHALAIDKNNRVILESILSRKDLLYKYFMMKPTDTFNIFKNINRPSQLISGNVVSFVEYYDGFHHWIYNSLPMLQALKVFEQKTGERCLILLPPNPPKYVIQSLELFGYDDDDFLQWNGGVATFESLIIPSVQRIENKNESPANLSRKIMFPTAAQWIRSEAMKRVEKTAYSKNIIIDRGDVGVREIKNKDQLSLKLEDIGYKSYQLAEMDFAEQVCLFNSAENIISPHGAGLSNLCFAEKPNIIEILGTNIQKPTYYLLAEALDQNYGIMIGQQDPDGDRNSDIKINISELIELMNEMGMTN